MPLPPALAARLQKRGVLKDANEDDKHEEVVAEHKEEVIAEDYDDVNKMFDGKRRQPVTGCPNKYNIYHDCSLFCQKRWGIGKAEPSPRTKRKYQKLIKRYPLSEGWQDVYDPGVGCYYFWNTNTDEVSWLPPHHPKARISLSAQKLKELIRDDEEANEDDEGESNSSLESAESENEFESSESESEPEVQQTKRQPTISERKDKQKTFDRTPGRRVLKQNDLDPMDPAAYSDIPRGKWSDGLEKKGDAKSGVDGTVSGPLFQMRPYPNPGEVMRMQKTSDDDSDD